MNTRFSFIDLFSGIGGFHLGLAPVGGQCVMASDIDRCANASYRANFDIEPAGDIRRIVSDSIPDFDLLCAGFPCQSFSHIGPNGGLADDRGALIYEVFRILENRQPQAFILENVKGLVTHNKGATLSYIVARLEETGYKTYFDVLEAKDFGLPQIRKRLFIVGIHRRSDVAFNFPTPMPCELTLSDILNGNAERQYAFTIRIGGRRSGINNRFNWDCYRVDGKERYLTVEECLQLQGFPKDFLLVGNTDQRLKLVGNSVPTTIVREIGRQLVQIGVFDRDSKRQR